VHVPGAVNSAHASHPDDALDQVTVLESDARLELLVGQLAGFVIQVLGDLVCFQSLFSLTCCGGCDALKYTSSGSAIQLPGVV
jgi:hypothetical protein